MKKLLIANIVLSLLLLLGLCWTAYDEHRLNERFMLHQADVQKSFRMTGAYIKEIMWPGRYPLPTEVQALIAAEQAPVPPPASDWQTDRGSSPR